MIIKSFEIKKIDLNANPFILLYGNNDFLKKQTLDYLLLNQTNFYSFDEKEILENLDNFFESLNSRSFFEKKKIIIIKRGSDKIFSIISDIINKKYQDILILIISENLEKKSKLRIFFEKEKNCISIPFYPDSTETLIKYGYEFINKKNIKLSAPDLNMIVNRANGNRQSLFNELEKIEQYTKNGKKITSEKVAKLSNLIENYDISELIDYCLINNIRKTKNILTENEFNNEDCVLIIRTFLNKLKKLLKLSRMFEKNRNIDLTISSSKPPIFWKQKEVTKQQILKLNSDKILKMIYKLSEIELNIKKNFENSKNLTLDFIFSFIAPNSK